MNFCVINQGLPYTRNKEVVIQGGTEARLFYLSKELVKRGHKVVAVTGKWRDDIPKYEVIDGIEFFRYGSPPLWLSKPLMMEAKDYILRATSCLKMFGEVLRKISFDFAIASTFSPLSQTLPLVKLRRVPLIAEVHDIYTLSYYLSKKSYSSFTRPKFYYDLFIVWLYNILPRYADLVTVTNEQFVKPLIEHGIVKEKIHVVKNGVDIETYRYSSEKSQLIATFGPSSVNRAIRIFRKVKENIGDAKLIVMGKVPNIRGLMQISNAGLTFTDRVTERRKIEILQEAKLLLSCSEYEGFGLPPIEGLACGAFPVVTDIPAHRYVLKRHASFFKDDEEAVQAISRLLLDEDMRESASRSGRKFVESTYAWHKICDVFCEMVNSFLQKP